MKFVEERVTKGNVLLDLYAGVGSIGFMVAHQFDEIISLEYDEHASEIAKQNAQENNLHNVRIINGAAEKTEIQTMLQKADTLIVAPPRSGLHPDVVEKIKTNGSEHFIYVSCNPATQARDWQLLTENYETIDWQLFDLYPQTPHVESVVVMKRK